MKVHLLSAVLAVLAASCRPSVRQLTVARDDWPVAAVAPPNRVAVPADATQGWPLPPANAVGARPYTPKLVAASGAPACVVVVGDGLNGRIHYFASDGRWLTSRIIGGRDPKLIESLISMSMTPGGELVLADGSRRRVVLFHSSLDSTPQVMTVASEDVSPGSQFAVGPGDLMYSTNPPAISSHLLALSTIVRIHARDGRRLAGLGSPTLYPSPAFTAALGDGALAAARSAVVWVSQATNRLYRWESDSSGGFVESHVDLPPAFSPRLPSRVDVQSAGAGEVPVFFHRTSSGIAIDGDGRIVVLRQLSGPERGVPTPAPPLDGIQGVSATLAPTRFIRLPWTVESAAFDGPSLLVIVDLQEGASSSVPVRQVRVLADSVLFPGSHTERSQCPSVR